MRKPFTLNAREASDVITLARERHLFLMEAMWSCFLPAMVEAKRIAGSGEIGSLLNGQAALGFASHFGPEHGLNAIELGGGALLDLGIYPLSLLAYFFGPITSVQAVANLSDTGAVAQTAFTAAHQSGALSTGFCSIRVQASFDAVINGAQGQLSIHAPFFKAERISIIRNDGGTRTIDLPHLGNGYAHQAIEVGRCLRARLTESPLMPLDETLHLMQTMDAMRDWVGLVYPGE